MSRLWDRIPPLARGIGIVAVIAAVVVVLSLDVALDPVAMSGGAVASSGDAPEPREAAAIIDDPAGERRLLFGGRGAGGLLGDLWSLDRP